MVVLSWRLPEASGGGAALCGLQRRAQRGNLSGASAPQPPCRLPMRSLLPRTVRGHSGAAPLRVHETKPHAAVFDSDIHRRSEIPFECLAAVSARPHGGVVGCSWW